MDAWKVYVDGYPTESYAYVLAVDANAAREFVRGEFEDGYGEIIVEREPKLDGDDLTDRSLFESGLGWTSCTRCDRKPEAFEGFCDGDTCRQPTYDEWGRIFCSERCRDRMPQFPKPGKQLYAMMGTEY